MPLKKITFKPGVNQENTRYTTEGGWYSCDKVRFRQGTPEKIGGWEQLSSQTFLGTARSLWPWMTLGSVKYLGIGTHLKYYVMRGGSYYDITPIRQTETLGSSPFATVLNSRTVTVTDTTHGANTGDFVTFSGATAVAGLTLNGNYQVTVLGANTYTIIAPSAASSTTTGGGSSVVAKYQIHIGTEIQKPFRGWGGGTWGSGVWGVGTVTASRIQIWSAQNFGEDLIYGPKGGALYYWASSVSSAVTIPGVLLSSKTGASDVPTKQNIILVSDSSRFVIAFGTNEIGSASQDTMLIRWSDQENAVNWTPAATNQAGSIRLSHGSEIVSAVQVRQEILVFTDTALYSMQYLGAPIVWGTQLLADNISIISDRGAVVAAGVTYWMGDDKFYMYDGRVQTMTCDLRQTVFQDFNNSQTGQVFATTVEKFNEIWWFYCSLNSTVIDKYVIYNYIEKAWYNGNMTRTAWVDNSIISHNPIAVYPVAGGGKLLYHEVGVDDNASGIPVPIPAYITSSEFDLDDGNNFGFIWRVLPDITFRGSVVDNPRAILSLLPLQNSGSGYTNPPSVAGADHGDITRSAVVPVEKFTGQVNIRVRGRQMSLKIASEDIGVTWQLGSPRIDIKSDGRR